MYQKHSCQKDYQKRIQESGARIQNLILCEWRPPNPDAETWILSP
ncbi:hypothetical protein COO91_05842 [Nostoc flagelliforme CCNUN1]|uniref:Uncharacterized protein n=1 Tax=Nostoc flagelliforme CCNUN1 TaxID=2038116 RepID=A0A2K8SYM9_9NOSO|nr:hypothetical protein COO91_05842 [Nostoc flagelliforme CCNUN1]